jgi:protocatechuate 3,4-dioxygenase beta subunit
MISYPSRLARREFLRGGVIAVTAVPALSLASACNTSASPARPSERAPDCEWCGAQDAPDDLSWSVRIAADDEPGERLVVSGTVYDLDGRAPAPGVLLYAYHTDVTGYYTQRGGERGNGLRHGRLRGWVRTDASGRYELQTIRPAPYPGRRDPAHIHMTVTPPGRAEYYVDDVWFEGDPLITAEHREGRPRRGGFPSILTFERGGDGVLRARRDIRLERFG